MKGLSIVTGLLRVATALAAIIPPAVIVWNNRADLVTAADELIKGTTGADTNKFQGPFSWDPLKLLAYVTPIFGLGVAQKIVGKAFTFVNKTIDSILDVF